MRIMLAVWALFASAAALQHSSLRRPFSWPTRSDVQPRAGHKVAAATAAAFSAAHAQAAVALEDAGAQAAAAAVAAVTPETLQAFEPRGITTEDTIVFVIGCVPFLWATIEFWRRIFVGDPFGTGQDSVIINDTSGNRPKAVRRVLGQDAITAAYILFALAGGSVLLVAIAGVDVLSGGPSAS